MKRVMVMILALLLALGGSVAALAEDDSALIFRMGQPLPLFERDGLSLSLAGDIVMLSAGSMMERADVRDADASVALTAIAENTSDKTLYVEYAGSVNGLSLGSAGHGLVNLHKLEPGDRMATYIAFNREWLGGATPETLESCDLTFRVYEKPTNSNDDNVLLYEQPVGVIRFDRATAAGKTFRKGDKLEILNENGVTVTLTTAEVSKGGQMLLLGGTVANDSNRAIRLTDQARVNGWSTGGYANTLLAAVKDAAGKYTTNELKSIPAHTTTEVILPVTLKATWTDIHAPAALESCELSFIVSEVDASGSATPWFTAPTGRIWFNRTAEAAEADVVDGEVSLADALADMDALADAAADDASRADDAHAESPAAFPLPNGVRFGDSRENVKEKMSAAGQPLHLDGALLITDKFEMLGVPDNAVGYAFDDDGRMNMVRYDLPMENDVDKAQAQFDAVRAALIGLYGEPNGAGVSHPDTIGANTVTQLQTLAAMVDGAKVVTLRSEAWHLDQGDYEVRIDFFLVDSSNAKKGTHGDLFYLTLEAFGDLDAAASAPAAEAPSESAPAPEADPTPEPTPEPEPEPTPEPEPEYEALKVGSKGDAVVKLQKQLIGLGYLTGSADGVYGKGTAGAVEKFQKAEGLAVTGEADSRTQAALYAREIPFIPDVVVDSVKLGSTYSGTPEAYVRLVNNGSDTVDRVDFYIRAYDAYGSLIKGYNKYEYFSCFYDGTLKRGGKTPSDWHWTMSGWAGVSKVSVCVYKYHYKGGGTVTVPNDKWYWQTFG